DSIPPRPHRGGASVHDLWTIADSPLRPLTLLGDGTVRHGLHMPDLTERLLGHAVVRVPLRHHYARCCPNNSNSRISSSSAAHRRQATLLATPTCRGKESRGPSCSRKEQPGENRSGAAQMMGGGAMTIVMIVVMIVMMGGMITGAGWALLRRGRQRD